VKLYFVAPEALQIEKDIITMLEKDGTQFEICDDFEK